MWLFETKVRQFDGQDNNGRLQQKPIHMVVLRGSKNFLERAISWGIVERF
jgi:hypothetical protein